jgi:hypothetical protein
MDLMTANKQMAEILAMFKDAEQFDFVRFDREFQRIADMAAQAIEILNNAKGN